MSETEVATAALRQAADAFYEIVSAFSSEELLTKESKCRNEALLAKLREGLRTPQQIRAVAANGFELCVRGLAALGATDVTIHECGEADMEVW